jgi:hypothetical protein
MTEASTGERTRKAFSRYCKAYYLRELRTYPKWTEERVEGSPLADDCIVYVHDDLSVTTTVVVGESVLARDHSAGWTAFLAGIGFAVPTSQAG